MDIKNLRKKYSNNRLNIKELNRNPIDQFTHWLEEVIQCKNFEANAMTLATATKTGRPSTRTVLLKGVDEKGILFFTNYSSRKGKQLEENPFGSVTFWWHPLCRQVSIEGEVSKISREESAAYFSCRPRGSQIGAWTSKQSQPLSSAQILEKRFQEMEKQFEGEEVLLPPFWGGYRITPIRFEFWQGQENRLHDRFCYQLENGKWRVKRLSP